MTKISVKQACCLIFLLFIVGACQKNSDGIYHLPDISIDSVSVKDKGSFGFDDSILFTGIDDVVYDIQIITQPADADIYYKTGLNDNYSVADGWIEVRSDDKYLKFYAEKEGFLTTDEKRIIIGFKQDSLLKDVVIYPNPFMDIIHIEAKNPRGRGELFYEIIEVTGIINSRETVMVTSDSIHFTKDLSHFDAGIYFIRISFGGTKTIHKILKM